MNDSSHFCSVSLFLAGLLEVCLTHVWRWHQPEIWAKFTHAVWASSFPPFYFLGLLLLLPRSCISSNSVLWFFKPVRLSVFFLIPSCLAQCNWRSSLRIKAITNGKFTQHCFLLPNVDSLPGSACFGCSPMSSDGYFYILC